MTQRIDPANPVPPANVVRRFGMDQVPGHVPPELIYTSGLIYGPEFLAAPHKFMAAMHDNIKFIKINGYGSN